MSWLGALVTLGLLAFMVLQLARVELRMYRSRKELSQLEHDLKARPGRVTQVRDRVRSKSPPPQGV